MYRSVLLYCPACQLDVVPPVSALRCTAVLFACLTLLCFGIGGAEMTVAGTNFVGVWGCMLLQSRSGCTACHMSQGCRHSLIGVECAFHTFAPTFPVSSNFYIGL